MIHGDSLFVLKITDTEVLNYSGRRERTASPLIVRGEPAAGGDLVPPPATRRKSPIPKSLINSDQHPERQVYHA
jgi:hypothetical protein